MTFSFLSPVHIRGSMYFIHRNMEGFFIFRIYKLKYKVHISKFYTPVISKEGFWKYTTWLCLILMKYFTFLSEFLSCHFNREPSEFCHSLVVLQITYLKKIHGFQGQKESPLLPVPTYKCHNIHQAIPRLHPDGWITSSSEENQVKSAFEWAKHSTWLQKYQAKWSHKGGDPK